MLVNLQRSFCVIPLCIYIYTMLHASMKKKKKRSINLLPQIIQIVQYEAVLRLYANFRNPNEREQPVKKKISSGKYTYIGIYPSDIKENCSSERPIILIDQTRISPLRALQWKPSSTLDNLQPSHFVICAREKERDKRLDKLQQRIVWRKSDMYTQWTYCM